MKVLSKLKWKEWLVITAGVVIMSAGFYFFLLPMHLVIGGVMGVAVLISEWFAVSTFIFVTNLILLVLGLIFLGRTFFFKTAYASLLSPLIIFILERLFDAHVIMRQMTESPLLISSVFGGLFVGLGLGLVIRNNATTGGIDVLQNIAHKYLNIPFSWAMVISDGTIILIAMLIDVQLGIYAVGAMIISAILVDRISIDGASGYTAFIVTDQAEAVRNAIFSKLDRGLTRVKVIGGYSNQEKEMIICTVYRLQFYTFKQLIKKADPKAFTFVSKTKEALGEGFSREVVI
jgi:uncharacterized membrane-anchored protein YitT (DUF2179 family)